MTTKYLSDEVEIETRGAFVLGTPQTVTLTDEPDFQPVTPGSPRTGAVGENGDYDYYTLNVVAGQTYVISLNGTGPNAMPDPQIWLYNSAGTAIAVDDEGGTGSNALLTFTATYTGVVYVEAGAWSDATHAGIPGDYTLAVAQRGADVSGTMAGAQAVEVGSSTLGFMDATGATASTAYNDVDFYAVQLVAGQYYEFQASAGWDYRPGTEGDLRLHVMDANGNIVAFSGDIASGDQNAGTGFVPDVSGTYYLRISHDVPSARAAGAAATVGYELSVRTFDLSGFDPLDAINWGGDENVVPGAADGEILVYFAAAGETFDGQTSLGWTAYEQQQAMLAFEQYANVTGLTYTVTTDSAAADFTLVVKNATAGDTPGVLGYFNPPGTDGAGIGVFWRDGFGWDENGPDVVGSENDNGGLEAGGYGFYTLVHEIGHGMGLAHPHDNGGGSDIMPGVFNAFDSYGAFDLNQGIFTVMSYNPGWPLDPANDPYGVPWYLGPDGVPYLEVDEAWNGTMSALDVALLQLKYGANADYNSGDTIYVLPAANNGDAFYSVIWDGGGIDSIVHDGTQSAIIDLTAATIDYSPTGGGMVSRATGVYGGFTIAQGVVIENARGGSGADIIIGNSAANVLDGAGGADALAGLVGNDVLYGRDGNDVLAGGQGADTLDGGAGTDTADYGSSSAGVSINLVSGKYSGGDATGDILVSIENVVGSAFDDKLVGDQGRNVLSGGGGSDTINGGGGADVLSGGTGADIFVFKKSADITSASGSDSILDLGTGDVIDLSALDAIASTSGNEAFTFIGGAEFSGTAGELRVQTGSNGSSVVMGDANGDGVADFQLSVTHSDPLTVEYFVL